VSSESLNKQAFPRFVFEPRARTQLLRQLQLWIHPKQDDVRVYPLPSEPEWCSLGRTLWDEGLLLTGLRLPPQLRSRFDLALDQQT